MCRQTTTRHTRRAEYEPHDRAMRVSDADRDRVADLLRRHAGEGRLEPDELEERLEAAYSARTFGDLDAVTRDLPPHGAGEARPRRSHAWTVPAPLLFAAVAALAIVVHPAIWFALFALCWTKSGRACHSPGFHGRIRGHHPGTARL